MVHQVIVVFKFQHANTDHIKPKTKTHIYFPIFHKRKKKGHFLLFNRNLDFQFTNGKLQQSKQTP